MDATKEITKSLGGDRLGSGNKMDVSLHKYNRSNHDLSYAWRSSANVGTLIPCMKKVALPGDTWSIDIESIVRTMPATGPLYGSYKMQVDVFECPIRLYNGLLHSNMTKIGMDMDQVKLPKLKLVHTWWNPKKYTYRWNESQIATDSLVGYLGIKGIGDCETTNYVQQIERDFNAVPILAYWDIYKNYYSNKQEETGRMIVNQYISKKGSLKYFYGATTQGGGNPASTADETNFIDQDYSTLPQGVTTQLPNWQLTIDNPVFQANRYYKLVVEGGIVSDANQIEILLWDGQAFALVLMGTVFPNWQPQTGNTIYLGQPIQGYVGKELYGITYTAQSTSESNTTIQTFSLQNIDNARIQILQNTGLNNTFYINNLNPPYIYLGLRDNNGQSNNKYAQHGLGLKTYQSDILNNWLKTEWITGQGGINEITAVDTSSGSFTMDALNLARKVYNMLNRIAVSGGTYEDYIEAVYSTEAVRRAESPIYCGGASFEIVFEEVVSQTAATDQPLGTLAGKGTVTNKRGGHVEIKVDEPSYIMAIMSITPRLDYSQGNDWDMTELDSVADLHKPELDGIGFQDLLQERAAWWGSYFNSNNQLIKLAMGKSPAWIDYMTAVNETHGEFTRENSQMFMTLNRNYEREISNSIIWTKGIKDPTTYIDPTKYNYVFADSSIDAQNFWVQLGFKVEARRVMSAKIIPTM